MTACSGVRYGAGGDLISNLGSKLSVDRGLGRRRALRRGDWGVLRRVHEGGDRGCGGEGTGGEGEAEKLLHDSGRGWAARPRAAGGRVLRTGLGRFVAGDNAVAAVGIYTRRPLLCSRRIDRKRLYERFGTARGGG